MDIRRSRAECVERKRIHIRRRRRERRLRRRMRRERLMKMMEDFRDRLKKSLSGVVKEFVVNFRKIKVAQKHNSFQNLCVGG
ncbi:unnamed protein product [Brassica oleracea]